MVIVEKPLPNYTTNKTKMFSDFTSVNTNTQEQFSSRCDKNMEQIDEYDPRFLKSHLHLQWKWATK